MIRTGSDLGLPPIEVPEEIDTFVWRLLVSDTIKVTLTELDTSWSIDDMLDAHIVLDIMDAQESRAAAAARQK